MKAFALMALFACSPLVMAAGAQDQPVSQQENAVEEYAYGMQLDVARVISSTDTSNACGIVPARMTYEDSNGQKHTVEYQVWGNGCTGG
ncbi:TPA: DUF2790 domain-containing protein [Pseudomonas aeruginosa]|uniref:DUF2790 domain-containing protein n=1 Tax=Pseudomonas aeruginosa TaxID=287 RepID=UPI000445E20F|nr:DUF2790 domain-containing protein [Pseudomonas aeruginosa]AYW61718.1 DUF2790 domain-containing protein [Pseudomonas aeruginosa]EIU3607649.1 DUF2790 domain-containing protein [Pseudomonas aeruginosa]EIU3815222.1 DUF2790 domain-containing protein [Pseudomonas aeruginosa]EIU3821578.1 DUF2790 domain-containing protein [Pseudomonas aeruginosa]ELT9666105.1 DUF2790 domain-containing protein [Pseudomonas aeruginosa]